MNPIPSVNLELHTLLEQAAQQWIDLTGVKLDQAVYRGWDDINVHAMNENLRELQTLDPTGLSAAMMLRVCVEDWALGHSFSAHEILNRPKLVRQQTDKIYKLVSTLENPIIGNAVNAFMGWLQRAVEYYNIADKQGLQKLVDDKFEVALIRRDAVLAVNKLRAYQFLYGDTSSDPIKYSNRIYQFWNVNSLIKAIGTQPVSGVTLSLLRDPKAEFSYFAFGIRNGGNIVIVTDRSETAHPLQNEMSRDAGRARKFAKRAFQYRFPYQLLKFVLDENEKKIKIPKQEGLVLYNQKAVILGHMKELPPDQIVWLVMMLALLNDRYWREGRMLPEQSYTGEMLAEPERLADATRHLPVRRTSLLELPPVTRADLTTDKLIKSGQWAREDRPIRCHEWMEKRYAHQVPEDAFNFIQGQQELKQLPGKRHDDEMHHRHSLGPHRGLAATDFGTPQHLDRERKFLARYNQTRHIEELAWKEFRRTRDQVFKAWEKRVRKNWPQILEGVARNKFMSIIQTTNHTFDHTKEIKGNIVDIAWYHHKCIPWEWSMHYDFRFVVLFGDHDIREKHATCAVNPSIQANVFAKFRLMTPRTLADVAACRVEDLPWQLRHYFEHEPYVGNSILERLDPLDWACANPWSSMKLSIIVCLSKRAFNAERKRLGLRRWTKDDWEAIRWNRDDD